MTDHPVDGTGPRRARLPRLLWSGVLAAVVLAATAASYWLIGSGDAGASQPPPDPQAATAEVIRETIADTRRFTGTLGHGEATTVTTAGPGTITGLPDPGTPVTVGTELYRLNERPVTALYGAVPMYRDLRVGDRGQDVAQLNANLTALDYGDCGDRDEFTGCTAAATRAWQDDLGLPATGVVQHADVVFVAEGSRIDAIHQRVGTVVTPGSPVLDLTGSAQVASLDLEVRDRDLLAPGTEVLVLLPDGIQATGTVQAAGAVPGGADDARGGGDDPVIRVEVALEDPVEETFLGITVEVVVELGERVGVLTVPVNALLALVGGGHGLEVVAPDGSSTLLPVQTGLFAQGRVEVSGDGLTEGMLVKVAGR